jgi:IclR family acetate operon transcriptional repressor
MDATILPGPGVKARPLRARADGDRHSIQSVDRALFLLETIAEAGGEASLTDLATRTGLNISTCHHLLATLIQRGFAAKVPGRRLYALGARILYLGHACLQVDLPRRAQPYLEAINQATGETVHLAALQGDAVVTLAVREHATRCGWIPAGLAGWKRRTPHRSARPLWPGCPRTRCAASSLTA